MCNISVCVYQKKFGRVCVKHLTVKSFEKVVGIVVYWAYGCVEMDYRGFFFHLFMYEFHF